jgi:glyoxylase-like metal-dependent hydrolase (beta-lactamase superfamily II)
MKIEPLRIPFSIPAPSGPLPRFVSAYIISTPGSLTLIDAGVVGSEEIIFSHLQRSGRRPEEISSLILTHAHPDHIGAAKAVREATGCTIAAHGADRAWIEDTDRQDRERPVPGFYQLVGGPVTVDRILEDGDTIEMGEGLILEVIHTPGHSPGSISLLLLPDMALFSGDAIPVPGDLPIYDDPVASLNSIERLMAIDGITSLFSSWDEPKEGEEVYWAMDDGYARIQEVHEVVKGVLADRPGIDPAELTCMVVKEIGLPAELANPMVTRSLLAHVRALQKA